MKTFKNLTRCILGILVMIITSQGCTKRPSAVIYIDKDASATDDLAAREVRKYIYQRTGELLPVVIWKEDTFIKGDVIFIGTCSSELMKSSGYNFPELGQDAFILKTLASAEGKKFLISGGSSIGTLYGAYHYAEQLGIGFYLDGDVIPDKQIDFEFPEMDIKQSPLFSRRGIQPFHDFPEGPDWWNKEDYKAVFSQLPKLKMNFFGLHTYPEGGVGPEPLVWIGLKEDINSDGTVKKAYHSRHFTTLNGTWGYKPLKTSAYTFDADQLFNRDDFGAEYMKNRSPWPASADEDQLFNDMGKFLNDVFSFAGNLGIKTCVGTEIPLVLPSQFINLLKEKGLDPESPAVRQRIYEGIFTRIKQTHPVDFYWFWTPENWTWSGNNKEDVDKAIRDFDAAVKAMETVKPGFKLATCGWVLGPMNNRAQFDQYLPKDIAFSCISRNLGWEPVDSAFVKIHGREKWEIPWMEDDPGLTMPQLWVGRMRRDAADAYAYGCNGFFGIHWRTRVLSMNVSALAKAAWDQSWNPEKDKRITPEEVKDYLTRMEKGDAKVRDLETLDFYKEWCRKQFGPEVSNQMAKIFSSLDGVKMKTVKLEAGLTNLPRPALWLGGPGGLLENKHPWDSVKTIYNFIDDIDKLRTLVSGSGNLERFDYWLNQFRYLKAAGKLACTVGVFNSEAKKLTLMNDTEKKELVNGKMIPLIKEEAEELKDVHFYLISAITTWGGIGNVANWQQHIIPNQILPHIRLVKDLAGDTSWINNLYSKNMIGVSKILVPSPQNMIEAGKDYTVKVICFNVNPGKAKIFWRPLGNNKYEESDLKRISDTYWLATIPSGSIKEDFEYYIQIEEKKNFLFPASTPAINQAVTILRSN
jgi:hypothetical protein